MKFCELLPVGSVVLLKDALKKLIVIGLMPIKHLETGEDIAYDYVGLPYPEGYIGTESAMLFKHENIEEIVFTGYSNDERITFVETIQKIVDQADDTVKNQSNS